VHRKTLIAVENSGRPCCTGPTTAGISEWPAEPNGYMDGVSMAMLEKMLSDRN
jgi:hypothetical protein